MVKPPACGSRGADRRVSEANPQADAICTPHTPSTPPATLSWLPVVLRGIHGSLQATEAHLPGSLCVWDARRIQVDSDRLPQPAGVQHKRVSQFSAQCVILDLSVELAQ